MFVPLTLIRSSGIAAGLIEFRYRGGIRAKSNSALDPSLYSKSVLQSCYTVSIVLASMLAEAGWRSLLSMYNVFHFCVCTMAQSIA